MNKEYIKKKNTQKPQNTAKIYLQKLHCSSVNMQPFNTTKRLQSNKMCARYTSIFSHD